MLVRNNDGYDVVVVGGGPVGLALAIGVTVTQRNKSLRVVVVDPCVAEAKNDWTRSYTYRVDGRGARVLERLGLTDALARYGPTGRAKQSAVHIWKPDGTMQKIPQMPMQVGYRLMRSQLLEVLRQFYKQQCQGILLEASVDDIAFPNGKATINITLLDGTKQQLQSRILFGCDGMNSKVRSYLCEKIDKGFCLKSTSSPSAGLVFKSFLALNPDGVGFDDTVVVKGKTQQSMTMLSFLGVSEGNKRPLGTARRPDFFLYKCKTVEEVYQALDTEFPQINARALISEGDVQDYFDMTHPIVFGRPSWAGKAACLVKNDEDGEGTVVAVLGDALHSFPPDIGQGLNAGLLDVGSLLDCFESILDNMGNSVAVQHVLNTFSKQRVKEGSSIARLMPKLVPYQYNLRGRGDLLKKSLFDLNNRMRNEIYKAVQRLPFNRLFYPSPVSRILEEPPVPYSVIWREYQWNSGVLISAMAIVVATIVRKVLLRGKLP